MTKVKIELIPDPDIDIFFKKGIRGWASYISNRYRKANNKYLTRYWGVGVDYQSKPPGYWP